MRKVSDSQRYSIITNDLEHCIECGRAGVNKHEIFFGTANRKLSKNYGLVIPMCNLYHHNQFECKGIHFDKSLCEKWQKIGQEVFMKYYNKTEEEFIKIFGKSYI